MVPGTEIGTIRAHLNFLVRALGIWGKTHLFLGRHVLFVLLHCWPQFVVLVKQGGDVGLL